MRSTISCVLVSLVVASVAACKKEQPSTPPQPTASAAPSASEVEVPATWSDELSKEQKVAFMKQKVMPAMAPVFKGHDAAKYEKFGCKTCHGPDMKDPDEFLPKLVMKEGKLTSFADKPEVSKFMAETVAPAMASALGLKPYDPATHEGFGCAGCHAMDMQ